jgi:phosphoribosylformylglycinamidine synthase
MNPHYGDLDPYHMAASAIDEALRNCVAVGADPRRIAVLDNFCWGYTDRPETLGSLVRAALACRDLAIAFQSPFISGKDSLNNEFSFVDQTGNKQTISIPPSLLISAMGQIKDARKSVSMDLKGAGNLLYAIGITKNEMGGSHYNLVQGLSGGQVPQVDTELAKRIFLQLHAAIDDGLVRSCHDLSEGGLAVALAEMAFAGGLGARVSLASVPHEIPPDADPSLENVLLFSESNSRFLCEVAPEAQGRFEETIKDIPNAMIGQVVDQPQVTVDAPDAGQDRVLVSAELSTLKEAWQRPLRW